MNGPPTPAPRPSLEISVIDDVVKSIAGPLTIVALRMEQARLRLSRGEDATASLRSAVAELENAFVAFEKGRKRLEQSLPAPAERVDSGLSRAR